MSIALAALFSVAATFQPLPKTPQLEDTKDLLLGVSAGNDHVDIASAFTGVKTGELGKGLFSGAWDVKQLGTSDTIVVAAKDGRVLQIRMGTGDRVREDIRIPDSNVAPEDNRKLTVFSNEAVIVWVRRLSAGYLLDLTNGRLLRTFQANGAQIDGVLRVGSRLYGVDVRGRIFTWTFESDLPKAISRENGHGGGSMSQPILNGSFVYSLSGQGSGNSMWLHRFNPSLPVAATAWDPTFAMSTPGWRFGNYMCSVGPGRLQFILLEYGNNGPFWGMGKFDTNTPTFSSGGPSYAWDGMTAVNTRRK